MIASVCLLTYWMLPFAVFVFPRMVPGLLKNMQYLSAVLADHSPSSWRSNEVAPLNM